MELIKLFVFVKIESYKTHKKYMKYQTNKTIMHKKEEAR